MNQVEVTTIILEATERVTPQPGWLQKLAVRFISGIKLADEPPLTLYFSDAVWEWHDIRAADLGKAFNQYMKEVELPQYEADDWDCDDAADDLAAWLKRKFKGAPIGIAWSWPHAFVVALCDGDLWVLDSLFGFFTDYEEAISIDNAFKLKDGRFIKI